MENEEITQFILLQTKISDRCTTIVDFIIKNDLKYQNKIDQIIATVLTFLLNEYDREMILEYYERVTQANLSKELGSLPKRGSFSIDLIKPEGWKAPTFEGLLN